MISQQKIKEWVDLYLAHIDEITPEVHVRDEEGYKFKAVDVFQRNFNIDAPDFAAMLERSIEHNNLVAGSWFFPRKMLLIFAEENEKETREALRILFNEKEAAHNRIDKVENIFDNLMKARNKKLKENSHSFIGIRFLSLLLGYRFPNTHHAFKPREWRMFYKYINEDFRIEGNMSNGERYEIYVSYVEKLREYIKNIPQIKDLRDQLTRGLTFNDEKFHWMTQDIIYVTARVMAHAYGKENPQQEVVMETRCPVEISRESEPFSMEFPLEEYLENFIVKNWDNIDFGERLTLYIDDEGTPAQQYPTSEGYIDLLAKDANNNFVVIELKKGRSNQQVVGQILAYVGWVQNNLVEKNQKVRGIIIVADGNQSLHDAVSMVNDFISVKYYRVKFSFENPR